MTVLRGLSALELGRLRVSVGYGTHKKGRPLSPVEVAELIGRARAAGNTMAECARAIRIDKTGLSRFLRLLKLPDDLRHMVDWGGGRGVLGYSRAVELGRIPDAGDMLAVARAVLERGLDSKETRQVVQILERSGRQVEDVLREVIGMRPVVERRYVFIGSVIGPMLAESLGRRSQQERDELLRNAMARVELVGASGRLGKTRFPLVGAALFGSSMSMIGKERLEGLLCDAMVNELKDAPADG